MLEQVIGKKSEPLSVEQFIEKAQTHSHVHFDLGTGDGLFIWRLAKAQPQWLCVGVDAARESLAEGSARAAKKPARGGTPNGLFLCANVLEPFPQAMDGMADSLSINFPWGSLLQATALPSAAFMGQVHRLLKPKGQLDIFINLHVFQKESERLNLELPHLEEADVQQRFIPAMVQAGFVYQNHRFIAEGQLVDVASTWGGRLTRNSKRPTLEIHFSKN